MAQFPLDRRFKLKRLPSVISIFFKVPILGFAFHFPFLVFALSCITLKFIRYSTHALLDIIDNLLDVLIRIVQVERLVHCADQHHLNLTVHHVSEDGRGQFHAEHDKQQDSKLFELRRWREENTKVN